MLDLIRREMIEAFGEYRKRHGQMRELQWEAYTKLREQYLRESAFRRGQGYVALNETIDYGGQKACREIN